MHTRRAAGSGRATAERVSMRYLVTGSAGHLGEGLMRTLRARGLEAVGLDILDSPYTDVVGSVADPDLVKRSLKGCDIVLSTYRHASQAARGHPQ